METNLNQFISIVLSKFVLGQLTSEEIPSISMKLIENDIYNDEILECAGVQNSSLADIGPIFFKGVKKLTTRQPTVKEATVILDREILKNILDGEIDPYKGARKIWNNLARQTGADQRLKVFIGLASEYEDSTSEVDREYYSNRIIEAARSYLNLTDEISLISL